MPLTSEQRKALWGPAGSPLSGHRLVSARPGTGKTKTLTEYCIDVVGDWPVLYAPWQGMAILSYTNVAKDELEKEIRRLGKASALLSPPHFVGTLDAFLNQYVFLPFGAVHMGCAGRPKLVGEPYGQWRAPWALAKGKPDDAYSPLFFDCYNVGLGRAPIRTDARPRKIGKKFVPPPKDSPASNGKIMKMKQYVWSQGLALQNDANYIALSILEASETLTRSLIRRFPVLIIDEAQDMTEVQHALLDHLVIHGLKRAVLMGDEYQAIYEWNTARPQLFVGKRVGGQWTPETIAETFRCSPSICTLLTNAAANGTTLKPASSGKNRHYDEPVQVRGYEPGQEKEAVRLAVDDTAQLLSDTVPHDDNADGLKTVAVVARSRDDASRLQAYFTGGSAWPAKPATWDEKITKDYLRVVHCLLKNDRYGAVGAYETLLFKADDYSSKTDMRVTLGRSWTGHADTVAYRIALWEDLQRISGRLPTQEDVCISQCAAYCDVTLRGLSSTRLRAIKQDCQGFAAGDKRDQDRTLSSLFNAKDERTYHVHPTRDRVRLVFSTVHGVKGETYDGVVFCVGSTTIACGCPSSSTTKWEKILEHDLIGCETKRIAYVALSRAAQTLFVLTPAVSAQGWQALAESA